MIIGVESAPRRIKEQEKSDDIKITTGLKKSKCEEHHMSIAKYDALKYMTQLEFLLFTRKLW